VLLVKPDLCI